MKILCVPLVLISMFAVISCSSSSELISYQDVNATRSSKEAQLETQIIKEANAFRAKHGKSPIQFHKGLSNISRKHSDFLSKNQGKFGLYEDSVSHYGFDGRSGLADEKFGLSNLAENVHATWANDSQLAKRVVRGWINSKGHRMNLLGDDFMCCGIGVRSTPNGTFSTMLLAAQGVKKMPMGVGPARMGPGSL